MRILAYAALVSAGNTKNILIDNNNKKFYLYLNINEGLYYDWENSTMFCLTKQNNDTYIYIFNKEKTGILYWLIEKGNNLLCLDINNNCVLNIEFSKDKTGLKISNEFSFGLA